MKYLIRPYVHLVPSAVFSQKVVVCLLVVQLIIEGACGLGAVFIALTAGAGAILATLLIRKVRHSAIPADFEYLSSIIPAFLAALLLPRSVPLTSVFFVVAFMTLVSKYAFKNFPTNLTCFIVIIVYLTHPQNFNTMAENQKVVILRTVTSIMSLILLNVVCNKSILMQNVFMLTLVAMGFVLRSDTITMLMQGNAVFVAAFVLGDAILPMRTFYRVVVGVVCGVSAFLLENVDTIGLCAIILASSMLSVLLIYMENKVEWQRIKSIGKKMQDNLHNKAV